MSTVTSKEYIGAEDIGIELGIKVVRRESTSSLNKLTTNLWKTVNILYDSVGVLTTE